MTNRIIKKWKAFRSHLKNNEGYSLIEIMVVMVIIGGLMAGTIALIKKAMTQKDITTATTQIKQKIPMALEMYKSDNGNFPSTDEGLNALVEGKYLTKSEIVDPWNIPYHYISPGEKTNNSFEVWSFGPDKREGGKGPDKDITSWTKDEEEAKE